MRWNRRGQFFLIAAVIIIGVLISLATVVNSVRASASQESFYRRADEVGYESKRVLDYGVYTSSGSLQTDLENFLDEYADYIAQEQVLFLFGNQGGPITAYAYQEVSPGTISLNTGGVASDGGGIVTVDIETVIVPETADIEVVGNQVTAMIEGTTYSFPLQQGQNFFFVIVKTQDEERFVAQG